MTTLTMSHNPLSSFFSAISNLAAAFSAARSVSAALEAKRTPDPKALEALGIDPVRFATLGKAY